MKIKKVKNSLPPLYWKGDRFKIIRINKNIDLMPIEAKRLKDGQVYGFDWGELK